VVNFKKVSYTQAAEYMRRLGILVHQPFRESVDTYRDPRDLSRIADFIALKPPQFHIGQIVYLRDELKPYIVNGVLWHVISNAWAYQIDRGGFELKHDIAEHLLSEYNPEDRSTAQSEDVKLLWSSDGKEQKTPTEE
jgi:hypothetical protein